MFQKPPKAATSSGSNYIRISRDALIIDATMIGSSLQEENHLKVLRLLAVNPHMNQRSLANALGVSLGKANYCLNALLDKGFIKMESFRKSSNKLAYAYLLTPVGIAEKAGLTVRFWSAR